MPTGIRQAGTMSSGTGQRRTPPTRHQPSTQQIEEDTETSRCEPFTLRVAPETAQTEAAPSCCRIVFTVNRPCRLEQRIWTEAQWEALPLAEQPPPDTVYCLEDGGYCHFREIERRSAL
jgi:hypothetical protein